MSTVERPESMTTGHGAPWLSYAEASLRARRLADARVGFDQAESLGASPNLCRSGRWVTAMLGGDFESAWLESDAIQSSGAPDPHRLWDGSDLRNQRLIVRCLHGLGDAVQMLQYASRLRAVAAQVVFEVPPRLLPLAPCFHAVEHAITWGEGAPGVVPVWDVQIEAMELPYLFRTLLPDLPIVASYLKPPQKAVLQAAQAMGTTDKPRVGFVWSGGDWNPERWISPEVLRPLLELQNIEPWSLQGGAASKEVLRVGIRDSMKACGDGLLALAGTIANLDLVITIDTLAAHLAGSMGKPVWVMLQHTADWRWMTGRTDSPWYPSMRLFRQPTHGDWRSVIEAVHDVLRAW